MFPLVLMLQFNNDADPPNITATPKNSLDANTVIAISYPSGVFTQNDGRW